MAGKPITKKENAVIVIKLLIFLIVFSLSIISKAMIWPLLLNTNRKRRAKVFAATQKQ